MNSSATAAMTNTPTPHRRRPDRRQLVMVIAMVAVLFLMGSILAAQLGERDAQQQTGQVEQQRDATAGQAVAAAYPVLDLCKEDSPVGIALRADLRNPCELAQQVIAEPIPTATPLPPRDGRDAPPITPAEIQAAVRAELALNPPAAGRTPSLAEVTGIVAQLLADTPDQIAAQVALYFAENPVRDGEDGRDAPGITDEQIRAAVAAELAANPPEDGAQGAQGVGVSSVRTQLTTEGCLLIFTLTNPADGSSAEQALPVPDGFCEEPLLEPGVP